MANLFDRDSDPNGGIGWVEGEYLLVAARRIPEPQRQVWVEWLDSLGIDARDVAVPGAITRDLPNRRVWWRAFKRDDEGRTVIGPSGDSFERVSRYVQLEAEPPLFPAEVVADERVRDRVLVIEWKV
jgi:hypothetical protein